MLPDLVTLVIMVNFAAEYKTCCGRHAGFARRERRLRILVNRDRGEGFCGERGRASAIPAAVALRMPSPNPRNKRRKLKYADSGSVALAAQKMSG